MANALWIDHAAELWNKSGPTGDFVRVLTGQLQDFGGNVLFSGTADECVAQTAQPIRLVPTTWERCEAEVAGADHTWQVVVE